VIKISQETQDRNLQKAITEEFSKAFTSLSARVEVFQTTQESFVESLIPKIKSVLPELNELDLKNVSAIYGICITDEVLANYEPEQFSEDLKYLMYLMKVQSSDAEETNISEDLRRIQVQPEVVSKKSKDQSSWADRTQKAMASETKLMKLLAAFYQANSVIAKGLILLENDIILHNINQRQEIAITSILIREHLLPLYESIYQIYFAINIDVDLRFITAQIIYSIENLVNPKREVRSQAQMHAEISKSYPLGSGDDIYWDLADTLIYKPYYEKLKDLLKGHIEKGINEKQVALESIRASMGAKAPEQGTDESLRSKVDSLIFETMQFNRPFDGQRKEKLRQLLESLLKRRALQEFGVQDISDRSKYTDWFMEDFFPIMRDYPQMLLAFIDIRHYRDFSADPIGHFNKHEAYMMNQFWFRMRKNGYKSRENSTPYEISAAFAEIVFDVLNDPKVMSFEV
jgi:hypothetical protein